jgi:hypothetical protein
MIQKFIQLNLFLNINNLYLQSQYLGGFGQERALTKFKWLNCQSLVGSMVRIPCPEHNNKSADFFLFVGLDWRGERGRENTNVFLISIITEE